MRAEPHPLRSHLTGDHTGNTMPAAAAVKGAQRARAEPLTAADAGITASPFMTAGRYRRSIGLFSPSPLIVARAPLDIGSLLRDGQYVRPQDADIDAVDMDRYYHVWPRVRTRWKCPGGVGAASDSEGFTDSRDSTSQIRSTNPSIPGDSGRSNLLATPLLPRCIVTT